jgi:hypothetical protein
VTILLFLGSGSLGECALLGKDILGGSWWFLLCNTSGRVALRLCGVAQWLRSSCSCSYSCSAVSIVVLWCAILQLPVVSSMVRYLALVMRLSCASSMVLLSGLPSLGFEKKKR